MRAHRRDVYGITGLVAALLLSALPAAAGFISVGLGGRP